MVKHSYSLISLYNLSKTNLLFVCEGTVDSIFWKPLDTRLEGHAPQTAVHSQVKKATVVESMDHSDGFAGIPFWNSWPWIEK
jgi:hypothetical protein